MKECDKNITIVRVKEVIYGKKKEFEGPFDEVAIVLEPMTPHTLAHWIEKHPVE